MAAEPTDIVDPHPSRTQKLAAVTRSSGPLRRLWALCTVDRPLLTRMAIFQVLQTLSFFPFTIGLKYLIDDIFPYCAREQVVWPIVVYALANLLWWPVHGWFTVQAFNAAQRLTREAVARLRRLIVDQLQRMSLSYFARQGAGAVSNQVTVDMGRVEGLLNVVASSMLVSAVLALGSVIWLAFQSPLLLLVALSVIPPQILIMRLMRRRLDHLNKQAQRSGEGFSSRMVEFVAGMRLTKSYGNEAMVTGRLKDSIEEMRRAGLEASVTMCWVQMGIQMANQFMLPLVWCVGLGLMVYDPKAATIGELTAFIMLLGFIQGGVASATGTWGAWMGAKPGLVGLFGLLDSSELEGYVRPRRRVELAGEVRFEQVDFRYPTSAGAVVLKGIDVRIPAGQRVGLVGETGAGKSTFLDLMLGFYTPSEGRILYDGHELAEVGLRQLRSRTAIMGQDAFLWNTSVRENIRFGRPTATDREVKRAAERAQAHAFIERLEAGYDTPCGERGGKLSGGQRQRIALARVFLRDPRIIVLDEPTSALDMETEARLQADLDELSKGRTTFIVAHRLSTLRSVDRILVFRQGQLVEDGAPDELRRIPDGHFARLLALQAGAGG
jgi:ABC-type multidrug transport system fused ATPase/permease subunit